MWATICLWKSNKYLNYWVISWATRIKWLMCTSNHNPFNSDYSGGFKIHALCVFFFSFLFWDSFLIPEVWDFRCRPSCLPLLFILKQFSYEMLIPLFVCLFGTAQAGQRLPGRTFAVPEKCLGYHSTPYVFQRTH